MLGTVKVNVYFGNNLSFKPLSLNMADKKNWINFLLSFFNILPFFHFVKEYKNFEKFLYPSTPTKGKGVGMLEEFNGELNHPCQPYSMKEIYIWYTVHI